MLLPGPMQQAFNLMVFFQRAHPASFSAEAVHYITFVCAVLGAVMAGSAAMMLRVLAGPFRRGEREAWWMLAGPLLVWFVPDTIYSLAAGYWPNAVLNTGIAIAFGVPLAATSRLGRPRTD